MSMTLDDRDAILARSVTAMTPCSRMLSPSTDPSCSAHARRRTPDDSTAEDLVQEAFVACVPLVRSTARRQPGSAMVAPDPAQCLHRRRPPAAT